MWMGRDCGCGMGILNVAGAPKIWGPFVPCPPAQCRRARLETSSTCQSPAEDRFLTRFCRLVYTQGTQVPITPSQSSPVASRQRRPPLVSWFLSRTHYIPHTHIHSSTQATHLLCLFIISASQPAAYSQPAPPKIPVSVTRRRQDNKPCPNTTLRDGILSNCHRGPAQQARNSIFGAPVPTRVWLFCPGQGRDDILQPRDPAAEGQRATSTVLSSTRGPETTVGPALTHPTPLSRPALNLRYSLNPRPGLVDDKCTITAPTQPPLPFSASGRRLSPPSAVPSVKRAAVASPTTTCREGNK